MVRLDTRAGCAVRLALGTITTNQRSVDRRSKPRASRKSMVLQADDATLIQCAMNDLPDRSRQLLVHREIDGLSYRELAEVTGVPIGTLMSGLSRSSSAPECGRAAT